MIEDDHEQPKKSEKRRDQGKDGLTVRSASWKRKAAQRKEWRK